MAFRHWSLLKRDTLGAIWHKARDARDCAIVTLASFRMRIFARGLGITLGTGVRFHGVPIIRRYPGSQIVIGAGCRFRSDRTNMIGNQKPCMLVTTTPDAKISLGYGVGMNGAVIHCSTEVLIGSQVLLGYDVLIDDSDHHSVDPLRRHEGTGDSKAILIEDNVWIGTRACVLKGVRIGKNSVIGANSVVMTDIPVNCIAVGNPCRPVKTL